MARHHAIGWLIGYFVFFAPFNYAYNGDLIWGLIRSIIGVAILIWILGVKWE